MSCVIYYRPPCFCVNPPRRTFAMTLHNLVLKHALRSELFRFSPPSLLFPSKTSVILLGWRFQIRAQWLHDGLESWSILISCHSWYSCFKTCWPFWPSPCAVISVTSSVQLWTFWPFISSKKKKKKKWFTYFPSYTRAFGENICMFFFLI